MCDCITTYHWFRNDRQKRRKPLFSVKTTGTASVEQITPNREQEQRQASVQLQTSAYIKSIINETTQTMIITEDM